MRLYPHSKGGGAYYPVGVACFTLRRHVPKTFGALAKWSIMRYSSIIRQREAVASALFTRRARAGSAKARRAGANEHASRLGSSGRSKAQMEGQSWECGSWRLKDAAVEI